MARFYSESWSKESKKCVTRQSSTGLRTHISGWDMGVEVSIFKNEDGEDEIVIYMTGGSNAPMPKDVVFSEVQGTTEKSFKGFTEIRVKVPKVNDILLRQGD